ncbi:MAG: hypothetical protein AAGF11_34780 [Myxococcota bacterium]
MTCLVLRNSLLLLTLTTLAAAGCDPNPGEPQQPGSSGDTDDPPTDTADTEHDQTDTEHDQTDTDTDTMGEDIDEGLFACEMAPQCDIEYHLDPWDDPSTVECAASLVLSGESGLILGQYVPGPGTYEEQTLVFVNGDGTAVVQSRERSCPDECELDVQPWDPPSNTQECTLGGLEALADACEAGQSCQWWPWDNLTDCTDLAAPMCEELTM